MKRMIVLGCLLLFAGAAAAWLLTTTARQSPPMAATSALCTKARAQIVKPGAGLVLDEAEKALMRDAFASQCWFVPEAQAQTKCAEASAAWARIGGNEATPAPQQAAGLAACRQAIDGCYQKMIELAAGERSSAAGIDSCLQEAVFTGEVAVIRQKEADQRARPDGDVVRLTGQEVAAVEAALAKAFDGALPLTTDLMRARDPMFLTFQNGRLIGEKQLRALRQLSHPKSHYFVKQSTESVINQVDASGTKDLRSWDVTFFIDRSGKTRLILPVGYLPKPYSTISAYVVTQNGDQSIVMEPVPVGQGLFVMDDPGAFQQILFHGEAKPTSDNQLYLLRGTKELNDRLKFFDAIRSAVPGG